MRQACYKHFSCGCYYIFITQKVSKTQKIIDLATYLVIGRASIWAPMCSRGPGVNHNSDTSLEA